MGKFVPDLRKQYAHTVSRIERFNIERHVIDQVGIGVCKPVFVTSEDKVRKIRPETVDKPFVFTGHAPGRPGGCCQKNHMSEATQFLIKMLEPGVGYKAGPELGRTHIFVGKELRCGFIH